MREFDTSWVGTTKALTTRPLGLEREEVINCMQTATGEVSKFK